MVLTVRCFKCGSHDARVVMGGREILQARCDDCDSNLLAEVLELEQEARCSDERPPRERVDTPPLATMPTVERASAIAD